MSEDAKDPDSPMDSGDIPAESTNLDTQARNPEEPNVWSMPIGYRIRNSLKRRGPIRALLHGLFAVFRFGWAIAVLQRALVALIFLFPYPPRRLPSTISLRTGFYLLLLRCLSHVLYAYCLLVRRRRRPLDRMTVLHISVISHKPFMLTRALRRQGVEADYLALNCNIGRLNVGYDFGVPHIASPVMRHLYGIYYFWIYVTRYDIIHYHFNSFVLPDGQDLDYLKRMKKLVVMHFRGCDIRQKSRNNELNPELNCCQECDYPEGSCETPDQLEFLEKARRYADLMLVTTPDLNDFVPEARHFPFLAPDADLLAGIAAVHTKTAQYRVVTSSNHPGVDGVEAVREAVRQLQAEGMDVELLEITRMSYQEAIAAYKSADLFVGKLRMGYYNNAHIECMMLAVPCISYIRPKYLDAIPDCPIIQATPATVVDTLRSCLRRIDRLHAVGWAGPAFVRRHHGESMVGARLHEAYKKLYTA